ncbi:MAG: outer membrane protein assembly factor BamA [Victivallaceae bacterium]|nr:outer membrane protein assembly factor BamA [Victivallaceae bacterium]
MSAASATKTVPTGMTKTKDAMIKKLAVWGAMVLCGFSFVLNAATVATVKFDQRGGYAFPEKMLLYNMQQKAGREYDKNTLNDDLKRLYGLGFFDDVVSEVKNLPGDQVGIIVKIKVKPRVDKIVLEGNKKYPTKDLKTNIVLDEGMPLNDNKLRISANRLRAFYKDKGYNDIQIAPALQSSGEGKVKVIFRIKENLRLKVNDVTFSGVTAFSSWMLKNAIANRHSYLSRFMEIGLLEREELEKDKARLRMLFWSKGYLDFQVKDIKITPEKGNPEYVDIHFDIYQGEPYKVGTITIIGNQVFKTAELMPLMRIRKGMTYNQELVDMTVEMIQNAYESLGYTDIACREVRLADFKTHIADLQFVLTEGRKFTVNQVIISGNNITKDKVIRRELVVQPGDPLDKNRIKASKERLMGMGYFKKVETVTVNSNDFNKKNVAFEVEEKPAYQFKVGGGLSSYYSLVGMGEIVNNNFDITDPENYFRGGGQRIRLQGLIGLKRNSLNFDFVEPWLFDIPLRFAFNGYWNTVVYPNWDETRIGFRTSLSKKLLDDFTSATIGYKFENVNVSNMGSSASEELRQNQGRQWVSQFSLLLNRDTRDSMFNPTSGYNFNVTGAMAAQFLGSTNSFYRLEAKGSHYWSLLDKALIFQVGGKIGTLADFNRNQEAPLFERYFLGGGETIRGFPYRSIAPTDCNDDPVGGQTMLLLTATMTHPIYKFVRGAIFVDAGSAWANSFSMNFNKMNLGVGYGLRIKVPYLEAPIQLDLAYPVVNTVDGLQSKLRFHFNMGFTW